ncbi:MAG TPA: hypothetical protein PLK82_06930, partial [Bacteroidales bacterium]|nr:hypothetical protein [Bacteroidales bacterium]
GDISILYYYNDNALRIRPNDLIRMVPVPFSYSHTITPEEQAVVAVSDLTLANVPVTFSLPGTNPDLRVDMLTIRKGRIRIRTHHTFANDGHLNVRIVNATKDGSQFSFTVSPVVAGNTETTVDLAGVKFDLSSSPNKVTAEVGGVLKQTQTNLTGQQLAADFEIRIDTVAEFRGYLGQHTFPGLQDTVSVNVFNNAYTLGNLYFMDPRATITLYNSIGIPANITIEKMVSVNTVSQRTLDIAGRLGAGAYIQVPSPQPPPAPWVVRSTEYTNENTGNAMYDFFDVKPDHAAFQVTAVVNPNGPALNFFTDTSSFHADMRVKLPLWGHFDHLTYQDTFDFSLTRPKEIEYLEFRTHLANGMPVSGSMQVYFTDESYNRKDSLAGNDPILIRQAPTDPATGLPYPGMMGIRDTTYILGYNRIQNLETVKKAIIKAVLESPDNGQMNVRLRATQLINLEFSARARLRKNIEISH